MPSNHNPSHNSSSTRPGVGLKASRQDKEHRPRNWEVKPPRGEVAHGVYETYQPIFHASTEGDLDEAVRKEVCVATLCWHAHTSSPAVATLLTMTRARHEYIDK